jgi:hypothetical protein
MTNRLQWRRPIAETLATGTHRRRWLSRCGSYCVERHQHDGLPTVYLAVMLPNRLLVSPPHQNGGNGRLRGP